MPVIHVTPDDLVKLRFAYRPLLEIPLSYQVLLNPDYQWPHHRWVEDARQALHGVDLPYLSALVPKRGFVPDFITQTPLTSGSTIEEDFEQVLATPDWLIVKNVEMLIGDVGESEMRLYFMAHPRDAIHCLVEDMRVYWQHTLADSWSRMVSVLEGDILYHGKLLALDGVAALISNLHDFISYQTDGINVITSCNHTHCPSDVTLQGDGLQLVPTIFAGSGRVVQITPEWRPMIGYSARGVGLYVKETRASQPLELALGAARAHILIGLRIPATTTELAFRLHVTSGTASQHLMRLSEAGLIEPRRSGKRVYYHLTERGEKLIALFERCT
jgi:DNA-binding transcriptional ArsR family regulator